MPFNISLEAIVLQKRSIISHRETKQRTNGYRLDTVGCLTLKGLMKMAQFLGNTYTVLQMFRQFGLFIM